MSQLMLAHRRSPHARTRSRSDSWESFFTLSGSYFAGLLELKPIGGHTALIAEAADASVSNAPVMDGESGDVDFPFGALKPLVTVGEYNPATGYVVVGVPDGMGAYLTDANTVRLIFQSESYGAVADWAFESYPFVVNPNGASFTGSHVQYVDYDRSMLADFMGNQTSAAAPMVKGSGNFITKIYNLNGDEVLPRSHPNAAAQPHFSNTDASGNWRMWEGHPLSQADYSLQSLCSAHLEEAHQWGDGIGLEDPIFLTNEEWTSYGSAPFTGLPAHAIELSTGAAHAVGVFTLGGFEKIVELNCGHPDFVCFAPSGYNGAFGYEDTYMRNSVYSRPGGGQYVWPANVVPARLYIGRKGYDASGSPASDFLSRNGLAHGQLYGFAVPSETPHRDDWHRDPSRGKGAELAGVFAPIDWRWDGTVRNFEHDGSWTFQHPTAEGFHFWNANGNDAPGKKTEHVTPDPRAKAAFLQSSTAGYLGIYSLEDITATITTALAAGEGSFPTSVAAKYTLLQGEVDITAQVNLGGKGQQGGGRDATRNYDYGQSPAEGKATFEDIDGIEWVAAAGGKDYLIIQEDSGNDFGERMFISEISEGSAPMEYKFLAMSGGSANSRSGVGIPRGTSGGGGSHEFSGAVDLSGLIAKDETGSFIVSPGDGQARRRADAEVPINEKTIALGLQAHNLNGGVIDTFRGDRGGQIYAYRPSV